MQSAHSVRAGLNFSVMHRLTWFTGLMGLLFCLLLGIIGAHALLRRTLVVQLTGHSPLYAGQGHVPFLSDSLNTWRLGSESLRTLDFSESQPQSEVVLIIENALGDGATYRNDPASRPEDISRQASRKLDDLRRRFPDAHNMAWLCALRAQWSLFWMQHNRLAGEISDADLIRHRAQGVPSPETTKNPPNFTPQDLQSVLGVIAEGARVEPHNAYWDWMRAQFLMYGWRDQEAWDALETGMRKTRFEGHDGEILQAYVKVSENALGRPFLPEEINAARQMARDFIFPGRGMARIIAWQAIKARRRGNHEQALKIYHSFCSLQLLRAEQVYSASEAQTSLNLVALVLSRERALGNILILDTHLENGLNADLESLEAYAAKHASRLLQKQIQALSSRVRQSCVRQLALDQLTVRGDCYDGMKLPTWQVSLGAFGAGTMLLQQSLAAGILWLLLGAVLAFCLPDKKQFNLPVERTDSIIGMVLLGLIMGLMAYGALHVSEQLSLGGTGNPVSLWTLAGGLDDAATLLYSWSLLGPVLFCSLLVQGMTIWRATPVHPEVRKNHQKPKEQIVKESGWKETTVKRTVKQMARRARGEFALAPLVGRFALFLFTVVMLYWWQSTLTIPTSEWIAPRTVTLLGLDIPGGGRRIHWAALHPLWPLALSILGLLLGWTRWIFASLPSRRLLVLYRLRWLHQLLGATTLLAGAGYIALSLWILPSRYAAEREVRTLLEKGENALCQQLLHEQRKDFSGELSL